MKTKRGTSFFIALIVSVAVLLLSSIGVYARDIPTNLKGSSLAANSNALDPADVRSTSTGIEYSTDNGATWKSVYLASDFKGYLYDSVNKEYVGIGNTDVTGDYGT